MQRALSQKVLGKKPHRELLAFLRRQLPRLGAPPSRSTWLHSAAQTRQQLLELFFLPDLVALCAPVPIHDSNRGPLRATKRR